MKKIIIILSILAALPLQAARPKGLTDDQVRATMKKATTFMVEKVSNNGGYLWNYAPDFSRVWGELECKPSMMWIERGTPAMGNVFLDAYHATGDEYYLKAAEEAAAALIWAQLPCGGWNYMADFAGEASLKDWYKTVASGYQYCAQEHLHYSGNATFDDGTIDAAGFLLRMYAEHWDPRYRPAIDKAIDFMIQSQYPVGGWPQRWPLRYDFVKEGKPDYSSFITINDGVHTGNINFLLDCWQILGEERVLEPIQRAMSCVLVLQGGKPQAGWAMQHQLDLGYTRPCARLRAARLRGHGHGRDDRQPDDVLPLDGRHQVPRPHPGRVRVPREHPVRPGHGLLLQAEPARRPDPLPHLRGSGHRQAPLPAPRERQVLGGL